jgi:hypothetical protein
MGYAVQSVGEPQIWNTTWTGFSSNPTAVVTYFLIGKMCTVIINSTGTGVSNATTKSMTVPFPAKNTQTFVGVLANVDNSTAATTLAGVNTTASSNVVSLIRTLASATWTASNNCLVRGTFTYEIE